MAMTYLDYRCGNTFTIGNFKGGVGKTKIVGMLAYDNSQIRGRKTLVIDLDPQANATTSIAVTFGIETIETTITEGVLNSDLKPCIIEVAENLDLIACNTTFTSFPNYINNVEDEREQYFVLSNLIDPIRADYDEIFIDVPPTISNYSDNAMAASDFSIIAFQTVEESFEGVGKYINYQKFLVEKFDIDLQVIEIVPCLTESNDDFDIDILNSAKELYGDVVSNNVIYYQKRLKRYSTTGIELKKYRNGTYDRWDYKAHEGFINLLAEIDARRNFLIEN